MKKLIEKYLGEGEIKTATFNKKTKELEYWTDRKTTTNIQCDNIKKAKAIIKNSGVEQKLEVR